MVIRNLVSKFVSVVFRVEVVVWQGESRKSRY